MKTKRFQVNQNIHNLVQHDFDNIYYLCSIAKSVHPDRTTLKKIKIEKDGDKAKLISTDGKRLFIFYIDLKIEDGLYTLEKFTKTKIFLKKYGTEENQYPSYPNYNAVIPECSHKIDFDGHEHFRGQYKISYLIYKLSGYGLFDHTLFEKYPVDGVLDIEYSDDYGGPVVINGTNNKLIVMPIKLL